MNWPGPEQECAALAESGQHLEVGAFFLLAGLGNLWVTGGAQQIRPPLVPPLIPLDPAAAGQTRVRSLSVRLEGDRSFLTCQQFILTAIVLALLI